MISSIKAKKTSVEIFDFNKVYRIFHGKLMKKLQQGVKTKRTCRKRNSLITACSLLFLLKLFSKFSPKIKNTLSLK